MILNKGGRKAQNFETPIANSTVMGQSMNMNMTQNTNYFNETGQFYEDPYQNSFYKPQGSSKSLFLKEILH